MPWIETIGPAAATGELQGVYERISGERGKVAAVLELQSLDPRSLAAHLELYLAAVFAPGGLARPTRELIGVAVSAANGCRYCVAHHARALDFYWRDAEVVAAFAADPDGAVLPSQARRIVDYALKLTRTPQEMGEEDVTGLREAGLSEKEILQAAQTAAYFNFVNRLVLGLGVAVDDDESAGYRY